TLALEPSAARRRPAVGSGDGAATCGGRQRAVCISVPLTTREDTMATWTPLTNQPTFNVSTMLLLTDGTVMCHEAGGMNWWRLSPDPKGSFVNGAWSALSPMHHTRLYYASAVLKDGRVFVAGGEYSNAGSETNTCEIYEPLTDTWTVIASPAGWA